jgi:RNA polymerase sigma-70 factor, ECF subfamily
MKLLAEGNQAEFDVAIEKYGKSLANAITRICPKNLGLDFTDLEQEARVRLWRALTSEKEIINVESYTYRIALSVTINAIRKLKSRREEQLELLESDAEGTGPPSLRATAPDASPEQQAERRELIERVHRALEQLADDRRLAVGLHLRGMTPSEIGELLQWSEARARNLAYRGLSDLRKQLRHEGIEYEG